VAGSTVAVEAVTDAKGANTEVIEGGAQIVPRFLFESGPISGEDFPNSVLWLSCKAAKDCRPENF
jgi:hypothetical protein